MSDVEPKPAEPSAPAVKRDGDSGIAVTSPRSGSAAPSPVQSQLDKTLLEAGEWPTRIARALFTATSSPRTSSSATSAKRWSLTGSGQGFTGWSGRAADRRGAGG